MSNGYSGAQAADALQLVTEQPRRALGVHVLNDAALSAQTYPPLVPREEDMTWVLEESSSTELEARGQSPETASRPTWAAVSSAGTSLEFAPVAHLVDKARSGDTTCWTELVSRFGGVITATGRRFRLPPAEVAELEQTTWLRLVENLYCIDEPARVGGWLATTARREALQLLKRAATRRAREAHILSSMSD